MTAPPAPSLTSGLTDTVTRRISRPASAVRAVLGRKLVAGGKSLHVGAAGDLLFDAGFTLARSWPVAVWQAPARLRKGGMHLARPAAVQVEVAEWSRCACELRIVPVGRRLSRWGERRRSRYFALAHSAADELAPLIAEAA